MADITQLYTQERVNSSDSGTRYSYEVYLITTDGKKQKLVGGLREPQQGLYIEQAIERYLGIEDRPVAGELPR